MNRVAWKLIPVACVAALLSAPLCASAAATAAPAVAVVPLHSIGAKAVYPRLTKFPDAKIMAKVNALLANHEKDDRTAYADCLSMLKDSNMKPDKDTYSVEIAVRYLSSRYLSIDVTTGSYCGGAYPNYGIETPLTVDLGTGQQVDWTTAFKPGFLPMQGVRGPSALTRLYRAKNHNSFKDDPDCRDVILKQDPFVLGSDGGSSDDLPAFWLDDKQGLVVQPVFPHVTQACADQIALSPAEFAPYLKDAKFAADLTAAVHR